MGRGGGVSLGDRFQGGREASAILPLDHASKRITGENDREYSLRVPGRRPFPALEQKRKYIHSTRSLPRTLTFLCTEPLHRTQDKQQTRSCVQPVTTASPGHKQNGAGRISVGKKSPRDSRNRT